MDAIDLLVKDHEAAKKLMDEILAAEAGKRKKLFEKLKKEIEAHDHMEETIFYPTLSSRAGGEDLQAKDEDAHEQVEEMLDDLAAGNPEGEAWAGSFKTMREKLLGHVRDEEQGYFIRARKLLSPSELGDLGSRMQRDKEQQLKIKEGSGRILSMALVLAMALAGRAWSSPLLGGPPGRLGIGLMAGTPSGLSLKYWMNRENAVDIVIGGFGYYGGGYYAGPNFHIDYLWHRYGVFGGWGSDAGGHMPIYVGIGGLLSPPNVVGVRIPFGLTYLFNAPFDVFFELAPTLLVGSVQGFGVDAGLGGRVYF